LTLFERVIIIQQAATICLVLFGIFRIPAPQDEIDREDSFHIGLFCTALFIAIAVFVLAGGINGDA
jgi:hypothetical protein